MKTLILNGSPRKDGDTVSLIKQMQNYLNGEVNILNSYYDKINPCIDCRFCLTNDGCIHHDVLQDIINDLDSYDNIIIASPLYFSELTGSLLNICSRFQQLFVAKYFRGVKTITTPKKGVLILTGGGNGGAKTAEKTAKILLKELNAEYIGTVLSHNTDKLCAKDDKVALDKAKEIALELNKKQGD